MLFAKCSHLFSSPNSTCLCSLRPLERCRRLRRFKTLWTAQQQLGLNAARVPWLLKIVPEVSSTACSAWWSSGMMRLISRSWSRVFVGITRLPLHEWTPRCLRWSYLHWPLWLFVWLGALGADGEFGSVQQLIHNVHDLISQLNCPLPPGHVPNVGCSLPGDM